MNFFCYRLPGSESIVSRKSTRLLPGLHSGGFYIAPFIMEESDGNDVTIPSDEKMSVQELENLTIPEESSEIAYTFPTVSTPRAEHRAEVEGIIERLDGNHEHKTIAAKVICGKGKVCLYESFLKLCQKFPSAFVFIFNSSKTGCWLGATPETLLDCSHGIVRSVALAGTRPAGTGSDWDPKNTAEQKIVSDYIYSKLPEIARNVHRSEIYTKNAGAVEHIATDIQGSLTQNLTKEGLRTFLGSLSPTPALCGYPREESLSLIGRYENFSRGYYGGFCGPIHDLDDFTLFVILRSLQIRPKEWCMFAGGGITADSNPDEEWLETERKARSILTHIRTNK